MEISSQTQGSFLCTAISQVPQETKDVAEHQVPYKYASVETQKFCLCLAPMVCYTGYAMILAENQAVQDNQTSRVSTVTFSVMLHGW